MALLRTFAGDAAETVQAKSEEEFLSLLPRAHVAITWHFKKEWYALAPRLRLVATPAAGRELVAWRDAPAGVKVHFGSFHGAIIAEAVSGFILAWAHGFFSEALRTPGGMPWRETWPRVALSDKCSLVAGTRAVIAGYGRIGRAVGGKLEALGVCVSGFTRANAAELPDAARDADWFVMALPGDTGTDAFFGEKLIRALPQRCVVVNVGRGNAVDERALLEALREGRLAGAYLDVFEGEPGPLGGDGGAILRTPRADLPRNLVAMPHSSAFCAQYLPMCFKELKDEGLI